jgi:hypothetical protein
MNLLDENIPSEQFELLESRGIRCRVLGRDFAQLSIADDNIVTLLHRLKGPTFFTRDKHFFKRDLCHPAYCLVWLDVAPEETAMFIFRFLRHPRFKIKADRAGLVARIHHDAVEIWTKNREKVEQVDWLRIA